MSVGTSFTDLAAAKTRLLLISIGLLILRVGSGGMLLAGHGWPKLSNFNAILEKGFADPLGIGEPATLALAIFAELFCAAALVLGLGTRLAAAVLIVNMGVAAFVFHAADPLFVDPQAANPLQAKEFALLYLIQFVTLALAGGGAFSLDSILWRRGRKKKA